MHCQACTVGPAQHKKKITAFNTTNIHFNCTTPLPPPHLLADYAKRASQAKNEIVKYFTTYFGGDGGGVVSTLNNPHDHKSTPGRS